MKAIGLDIYNQTVTGDVSKTLNSIRSDSNHVPCVLSIHEASGQDITFQDNIAYSIVTGGGKPGQGFPCVLIAYDETDNTNRKKIL